MLSDGLALIGTEPGGFGLLQTPPIDLARVEVIKGVASALYGGSALGGVLNLVSREPGGEPEVLLNRTSLQGTDAVGFATGSLNSAWAYTLTGGAHFQERKDLDGDAWADLPHYERYTLRPRLFYSDESGRSLFMTVGLVDEERGGGTLSGQTLPEGDPDGNAEAAVGLSQETTADGQNALVAAIGNLAQQYVAEGRFPTVQAAEEQLAEWYHKGVSPADMQANLPAAGTVRRDLRRLPPEAFAPPTRLQPGPKGAPAQPLAIPPVKVNRGR